MVGGALLTVGVIAATLVATSGTLSGTSTVAASGTGTTATVGPRDLQVTLRAPGTLQRAYEWTVNHLAVATPVTDVGTAPAGVSGTRGSGAPTAPEPPATPGPKPRPAPTPKPAPIPMPTPTSAPEPTPTPTPAPTTEPTPTPTPDPTTEPTPTPTPSQKTDMGQKTDTGQRPSSAPTTTSAAWSGSAAVLVVPAAHRTSAGVGSTAALVERQPSGSSTLTSVLAAGAAVDRGTAVYSVDAEPVVALLGTVPAWRTLQDGVSAGADVRQLEENLTALGHGDGLTVDEEFTSATAAAVEEWEAAIGRSDPDGSIELGEVVFVPEPGLVVQETAAVGNAVRAGAPVLTVGSLSQVITAEVDVDAAGSWAAGSPVVARWQDGRESAGAVSAVGRDVVEDKIQVTIALTTPEPTRSGGSLATVVLRGDSREGALAAPVAALVDGPDGRPAVRVVDDQKERVVAVGTGIVADGWVEITSGLNGGELVRLPG